MARPDDDPLGARPTLPLPDGAGADRGRELFRYWLGMERRAAAGGELPETPPEATPAFGGGRRYDRALATIAAAVRDAGMPPDPEATQVFSRPGPLAEEPPPDRPPPGAPTIRPPALRRATPDTVPQELLESTAEGAILVNEPDGSTSFEIEFRDDVFSDVTCRIGVANGRVVATFRAADPNTRRLLEAEAGRLRAQLEARGLRVESVIVQPA